MITGSVREHEAIIPLEISVSGQHPLSLEAVIDTGFNGYLTLPGHLVSSLQLPFAGHRRGTLADGSVVLIDVHLATVIWHGHLTEVLVSRTAGTPLVGMSLLHGSRLTLEAIDEGEVLVEEVQRTT